MKNIPKKIIMVLNILKLFNLLLCLSCLPAQKNQTLDSSSILFNNSNNELPIPNEFRRWKTIPIKISFSTDFSQEEITLLSQHLQKWNEKELYFTITENFSPANINLNLPKSELYPLLMSSDRSILRVYKIYNWNNFNPMSLGMTVTSFFNKHLETGQNFEQITGAFTLINMSKPLSLIPSTNSYSFPTVLAHEIGHALGLDHLDPNNFIMNYNLLTNTEISPQLEELDLLKSFYQFSMENSAEKREEETQFKEHDFSITGCSSKIHTKKKLLEINSHL